MNWIRNSTRRIIPSPFILHPNYQQIGLVKAQIKWCEHKKKIKWCEESADYFLKVDFDYQLFSEYIELAENLKKRLQKLAR